MPNIKFYYLYRDSANYKIFGYVVFSNAKNITIREMQKNIDAKLIDKTWFHAIEWGVPNLYLEHCDFSIDPTWHEFEGLEYTNDIPTQNYNIENLILMLKAAPFRY